MYLLIGMFNAVLILLFPIAFVSNLRHAVIILKTVSLKMKNKENKRPPSEVKQSQSEYVQEFDKQIQSDGEKIANSKFQTNLTLLKMLLFWPMILFVFFMAAILKLLYINDQDLP